MARMTTPTLETAKPSSSSKRTSGAKHAYLSRNGVVVISALEYRKALEREQNERERMLLGVIDSTESVPRGRGLADGSILDNRSH